MEDGDKITLQNECDLLQDVDHPNIIKIIEVYDDNVKKKFYMVMELMTGGELFDRILDKE